jgi:hypothetical protein
VTDFPLTSVEQLLKCLQFLKELAPRASRVAYLVNLDDPGSRDYPGVLASAAAQLGVTLIRIEARNVSDLPQAFTAIAAAGANAIFLVDDPALAGTREARKEVIERALSRRLPLASTNSGVASEGGLVSFGTDRPALARACRVLCRQDSQGCEAGRSACRASIHIQVVGQRQDCQGARPDSAADAADSRRRVDPVALQVTADLV